MNGKILERTILYEEVWTVPMARLAPNYGLSDKGLAKICHAMDIPIPYRGFWAKKAAGKNPPQTPLPAQKSDTITQYQVNVYSLVSSPSSGDSLGALDLDLDLDFIKRFRIEDFYAEYHPLVESARAYFQSKKNELDSPILKPSGDMLAIETSKENLDRALRIAEGVIRGIEQIGGTIELGKDKYGKEVCTYAIVQGERIAFSLKEQEHRIPHTPTEEELRMMKKNQFYHPPFHDNVPSNEFSLEFKAWTLKSGQRKWTDKPGDSLDRKIGGFLIGLLRIAPIIRRERLDGEERQRKEQMERDRIRLEQEKRDAEHKRLAALNSHLKMLSKVEAIDKYLEELNRLLRENMCPDARLEEINRWMGWVKSYRDKINPLNPNNLLFEHSVPEELCHQQDSMNNTSPNYPWTQPEQRKERSWGWWDRPVWKW